MATPFARIVNQLGYSRKLINPNRMRVIVPGLPYTSFDAHEHPQPWSIVNIMDSAQISSLHPCPRDNHGSLLELHDVFTRYDTLIAASRAVFSRHMYDKTIVKSPIFIDNTVVHAGRSTLNIQSEMKTEKETLATVNQLQILVDKTNRKSAAIPDWWKGKYDHVGKDGKTLRFPGLHKPELGVSRVPVGRIGNSDTDAFQHINFSHYVKYVFDGLCYHIKPRVPLLTKSVTSWYRQECHCDDTLFLDVWEGSAGVWSVDMTRAEASVYQCIIEFFP